MSSKFLQDTDYWIHKTKAFLHDPPDKAIHIPGHEERSNAILAALGMEGSTLHNDEYKQADIIASGMDRACLPGYVAGDENKNGAVDFLKSPQITHPTGSDGALCIDLPQSFENGNEAVKLVNEAIQAILKDDLGCKAGSGKGLSEDGRYKGNETAFAPIRFHYLFFMLRRRLTQKNIGGLGGLWHRLPADTRLPDHSIWQHCGMVSALASCQRLSDQKKASLMVYAITPVQDFVTRARKLRDYWSGSIILSWLAFEGIKAVFYNLGADHIVYPSLHGQPLVDDLLKKLGMEEGWFDSNVSDEVASFPNKFVCLVPQGKEQHYAKLIENAISSAWRELGEKTLELLSKKVENIKNNKDDIKAQFDRQMNNYWEHHWAAAPLVAGQDCSVVTTLLHNESIAPAFDFWNDSQKIWSSTGEGQLYSVSHRLVQAGMASGKARREDLRPPEEGIKCDLFGEFEILHYQADCGKNPKPSEDSFWKDVRAAFGESDFGKNERLCALGMVKRLAYRVCKENNMQDHPLHEMFKNADSFPSTTEMALHDWWRQLKSRAKSHDDPKAVSLAQRLSVFDEKDAFKKLAQWYHAKNEPESVMRDGTDIIPIDKDKERTAAMDIFRDYPVKDVHKYYAVLMMDGDKMGKLINGETLGSKWETVLHSDLVRRFQGNFDEKYKNFWNCWLNKQRIISPAVHAAISEALGDFSLLAVPRIIVKHNGRLIYAGGDDVCAVLPASTVLAAAREIAEAYQFGFVVARHDKQSEAIRHTWQPEPDSKLGIHLGNGEGISISAGIMVAHHKKPLGRVMERAHELLNMAKNKGGRNAFALEVDKRSGGGRIFMAGWQEKKDDFLILDHFLETAKALKASEKAAMSSSLAYRLATFEDGLNALVNKNPAELAKFIAKQLDRSGLNKKVKNLTDEALEGKIQAIASHVAALIERKDENGRLMIDSLIVANFIGHCLKEAELC